MAGKSSVIELTKKDGESKWKNLNAGLLIIAFLAALLVLVPAAGWGGETVSDDTVSDDFDDDVLDNMWDELESSGIAAFEENQRLEFRTDADLQDEDNWTKVYLMEFIQAGEDFRARVDFNSEECTEDTLLGMMIADAGANDSIDECITLGSGHNSAYDEKTGHYWVAEKFSGDEEKARTEATDQYSGTLYVEYKDQTVYLSYKGFDTETAFASYDIGENWTELSVGLAAWTAGPELSGEDSYFDNFILEYAGTDGEYEVLNETKLSEKYNWLWFRYISQDEPLDVAMGTTADYLTDDGGPLQFDEKGNWSFSGYGGTYSINEKGFLELETDDDNVMSSAGTFGLADDLLIIPTETDYEGINIAMNPHSAPENIDLSGRRYNYIDIVDGPDGPENSGGYIEFHENELTMHVEYNPGNEEEEGETKGPYSYSITDQGYLEVDVDEYDQTKLGLISPDENLIVATDKDLKDEILFMVRADKTPGMEDLSGKYNGSEWDVIDDEHHNDYPLRTASMQVLFDGNENWEFSDGSESGTYDIDENGRLVLGEKTYGPVTSDGSLFFKPDTDPDEAGISIATKTVASVGEVEATNEEDGYDSTVTEENTILTSSQLEETFGLTGFEPVGEVSRVSVDVGDNSTEDDPAVMTLSYDISGLSGTAGDYKLMKLIGDDLYRKFEYAEEGNSEDGDWWLEADVGTTYVSPEDNLENSEEYTVFFKVKDNGKFDLDDETGVIKDPTVLGTESESTDDGGDTDDGGTDDDGGGGSSGCFINSLMR